MAEPIAIKVNEMCATGRAAERAYEKLIWYRTNSFYIRCDVECNVKQWSILLRLTAAQNDWDLYCF